MLMEMIGAEWARRRAQLGVIVALYLSLPLLPVLVLGDGAPGEAGFAGLVHGYLALGVLVASASWGSGVWAPERKGRWVYYLSLPVERWRLFALRYLAGLFWLALAVAVLAAAAWAAGAAAELPPGLYAYPGPLAAWAALASWLLYTAGFVVAARWSHPGRVLLAPVALLVLALVLATAGVAQPVMGPVMEALLLGPFTPLPALYSPLLIGY